MKFSVIGGDRRSALLCSLLCEDGHKVQSFALEKAGISPAAPGAGCMQACVYGADCVILPCPAERNGWINTPLSDQVLKMENAIAAMWPGQLLCGGRFSVESSKLAERAEVVVADLLCREAYEVENAAITAESAIGVLLRESERTVRGAKVLVCGWGRVGKQTALRLAVLGAHVTIAARGAADRAAANSLGLRALGFASLEGEIGGFDWIINTVPAKVLSDPALCMMGEGTMLIELASPPGGFDRKLAENIGLKVVLAQGLPGKCAPMSSARLIRDTIYGIIREQEERE